MIEIRLAEEKDAQMIIDHWNVMRKPMNISEDEPFYSHEEEQAIIRKGHKWGLILVAFDGDRLVGICTAKKSDRSAYSHNARVGCSINPAYCGQGIGTRFLKRLQDMSLGAEIHRLEVISYMNNCKARKLFYECGWNPEGVMQGYARQGDVFIDVMLLAWHAK